MSGITAHLCRDCQDCACGGCDYPCDEDCRCPHAADETPDGAA